METSSLRPLRRHSKEGLSLVHLAQTRSALVLCPRRAKDTWNKFLHYTEQQIQLLPSSPVPPSLSPSPVSWGNGTTAGGPLGWAGLGWAVVEQELVAFISPHR